MIAIITITLLVLAAIAYYFISLKSGKIKDENKNNIPDVVEDTIEEVKEVIEEVKEVIEEVKPKRKRKPRKKKTTIPLELGFDPKQKEIIQNNKSDLPKDDTLLIKVPKKPKKKKTPIKPVIKVTKKQNK